LAVKKGDADYSTIASSVSPTSAIELFVPEEPHLHVAGAVTFSGHSAVAVEGTTAASSSTNDVGSVTLFVSTTAPYLPLGATLVVTNSSGQVVEREAALYGKWNKKVAPIAPKDATPVSSLTSG
jgi:hypothetical protein